MVDESDYIQLEFPFLTFLFCFFESLIHDAQCNSLLLHSHWPVSICSRALYSCSCYTATTSTQTNHGIGRGGGSSVLFFPSTSSTFLLHYKTRDTCIYIEKCVAGQS